VVDQEDVLTCFNRFRDALAACDTEALDELLAQDYRGYTLRGELEGRDVILDAYRPGVTTLDTWEVSGLEVTVFPPVGIVTGKGYVAGAWKGIPWSHELRFCDIFLKRESRWELYLSQATPIDPEAE
jgi:hypothetical protein